MSSKLALVRKFDVKAGVFQHPLILAEIERYKGKTDDWSVAQRRYLESLPLEPLKSIAASQKEFLSKRKPDLLGVILERDSNQLKWLGPIDELPNESPLHYKYRKEVVKFEAELATLKRIHFFDGRWHPREIGMWDGPYDRLQTKLTKAKEALKSIQDGMPPAGTMFPPNWPKVDLGIPPSVEEKARQIREQIELEKLQENARRVQAEKFFRETIEPLLLKPGTPAYAEYIRAQHEMQQRAQTLHLVNQVITTFGQFVAPLMKTVAIAFAAVPGAGPFLSAGLIIGIDLASGKRVDEALIGGIAGVVPGGPIAQTAYRVGVAIVQGKDLIAVGLDSLPIPSEAKNLLGSSYKLIKDAAEGKPVSEAVLNAAIQNLPVASKFAINVAKTKSGIVAAVDKTLDEVGKFIPPEARHALSVGIGVAKAQYEQKKALIDNALDVKGLQNYAEVGKWLSLDDKLRREVMKVVPQEGIRGYHTAVGIYELRHRYENAVTSYIEAAREKLSDVEKEVFDIAVAQIIGGKTPQLVNAALKRKVTPRKRLTSAQREMMLTPAPTSFLTPRADVKEVKLPPENIVKEAAAMLTEPSEEVAESPAAMAGFQVAQGIAGRGDLEYKTNVLTVLGSDPELWKGAQEVIVSVETKVPNRTLWYWLKRFFGLN